MANQSLSRRRFLVSTVTTGVAAMTARSIRAAASANEKIVVGVIGAGGRGAFLMPCLLELGNVEIAWVCDVDESRSGTAADAVEKLQKKRPRIINNYEAILDDKSVEAVIIATPDHWHALATIHACQAGKDVYVEKPASHSMWEGRQMVKAARKYGRVVQLGTQTRSGEYTKAAAEYIRSGKLGHVYLTRVLNMKDWPSLGHAENSQTPPGVDYDRWLGPAPARPFNLNHFHYKWHLWWDYSGGDIINDGIHQIDAARMLIGKDYPKFISSTGGRFHRNDDGDAPNTQVATWDFGDTTMVFELALNTPYMEKMPWELRDGDEYPNWTYDGFTIQLFGEKGTMFFERHGGGWQVFGLGRKKIAEMNDHHPHMAHLRNFFACMKTRARPNADIEEGHRSTLLAQTANISYRLRGRRLELDPKTERFVGDPDADQMIKRTYRKPYVVPDVV